MSEEQNIQNQEFVSQMNLERLSDQEVREVVREILKSAKDIEDLANSEDTQLMIKSVGLYQQIREALVDKSGYPRKDGKYFNPEGGLDITKKMREFYPDSFIASLVIDRINNFGFDAPEGSEKLKEFLANQKDLSV